MATYYQTATTKPETLFFYYVGSEKELISVEQAQKLSSLEGFEFVFFNDYLEKKTNPFWDVFDAICQLPALKKIKVSGFESNTPFLKSLKKTKDLRHLILTNSHGTHKKTFSFEDDIFKALSKLQIVDIVTTILFEDLPVSLFELPFLEHLNLKLDFQNIHSIEQLKNMEEVLKKASPYLKQLHITIHNMKDESIQRYFLDMISQNIYIEHVSVGLHADYIKEKKVYDIDSIIKSEHTKYLAIIEQNITQLPKKLNREYIETLFLRDNNLNSLGGQFPNLKLLSLNGNKNLDIEKVMNEIEGAEIEELHLESCKINKVPQQLTQMTHLKRLYLAYNKIETLPVDFYKLENLHIFNIGGSNPITKNTEVKKGNPLLTLFKNFKKLNLTDTEKQIQTGIFVNNQEFLETKTHIELVEGCLKPAHKSIERNLIAYLEKKIKNPLLKTTPESIKIAFWGGWESISIKELKEFCKKYNVKVVDIENVNVTHICIGENFKKADIKTLQKVASLPWGLPSHLKQWMEQLETPFLKQLDESALENLEGFLSSSDIENQKIALEMMKTGGIPDNLLYAVILISLKRTPISLEVHKLLQKYVDAELYSILARIRVKFNWERMLNSLLKNPLINRVELAKAVIKFEDKNFLLANNVLIAEEPDWIIQYFTNNSELEWHTQRYISIGKIFKTKADLGNITVLHIDWGDLNGHISKLKKMPNLKTIYSYTKDYYKKTASYQDFQKECEEKYPQYTFIEKML
ncbi:MAG: leucine-rich repeat domain-containing protein [Raineya sp.]|jgi:hypothetical protein|nr:leucine-rich repeat domain-containing protein [Raineya sp.]